jgi:hypothetical protein
MESQFAVEIRPLVLFRRQPPRFGFKIAAFFMRRLPLATERKLPLAIVAEVQVSAKRRRKMKNPSATARHLAHATQPSASSGFRGAPLVKSG